MEQRKEPEPNPSPTSVDPDSLFRLKPDPEPEKKRRERAKTRTFWFLTVPLAAVLAFGLAVYMNANIFLPAWGIITIVLWGGIESASEKDSSE
jgi:hypothetical protein